MRGYEVVVILDAELADEGVQEAVQRFQAALTGQGAQVGEVSQWGRRRLAYPIKHKTEGYYILLPVQGLPAALAELNRLLLLDDQVLRHRIFREMAKRAEPAPAAAATAAATAAEPEAATAIEPSATTEPVGEGADV